MDREPDMETESFKAWIPDEKEKLENNDGYPYKYKDMEIKLYGFNILIKKGDKNKTPFFGYKWKHDKQLVIFVIFEENEELIGTILPMLKSLTEKCGYGLVNLDDTLKSVYNERDTIENLQKNGYTIHGKRKTIYDMEEKKGTGKKERQTDKP